MTSSGITLLWEKKGIGGGDSVFSCPVTLKALPYLPSSSSCDSGRAGVSGGVRQSQTGRMFLSFSFRKHPLGFSLFSLHSCLLIHECINMDLSFLWQPYSVLPFPDQGWELGFCFTEVDILSFPRKRHGVLWRENLCHRFSACVPLKPKFMCWNPTFQGNGINRWGFGQVIKIRWGCEDGALMNELVP